MDAFLDQTVNAFSTDGLDLDAVTVHQARRPHGDGAVEWAQETGSVQIFVDIGAGTRGRDIHVSILARRLEVVRKVGGGALLKGGLGGECDPEESEWEIVDGELAITLKKVRHREWLYPLQQEELPPAVAAAGATLPTSSTSSRKVPIIDDDSGDDMDIDTAAMAPEWARSGAAKQQQPASAPPPPAKISSGGGGGGGSSGAADSRSHLGDKYRQWDKFDEVGELMKMENEGKSADEPGFTLRATQGVASMQATEYVKDREEIELDEELKDRRQSLQEKINQSLVQAAELKDKGNAKLRLAQAEGDKWRKRGLAEDALVQYQLGEDVLEMAENAAVLLSQTLRRTLNELLRDLRSNGAQAAIMHEDYTTAIDLASAVLGMEGCEKHEKALYRRAFARLRRENGATWPEDVKAAKADLEALLRVQPNNGAARKLLDDLEASRRFL